MSSSPVTLGRGLGRSLVVATVIGMITFGIAMALMIYFTEVGETCNVAGEIEDPPLEIVEQTALAFAFALPFGVTFSILIGRTLTHTTTERLDEVIASAALLTGERLEDRLPVSAANDALDQLSIALNAALERIANGVQAQAQFAADASHELRTPLAVITTNLEVARRKHRETPHWEHVADDALAEVHRMGVIVDKLLELSRAGGAGLQHAPTELRKLATTALARAVPKAAERGVKLELVLGAAVTAEVDADTIGIALDNLVRNAIDHSPQDATVTVTITLDDSKPRIVVDDRGPGVPVELRERIFEPFARAATQLDRTTGKGLGLGLAICRRIVNGHRGSVICTERPGGGARFVIELPPV
ncbi:MAG: HAMP domain-containing sensor histidine kinase [Kofleriaceae bacterium]